MSCGVVGVSQRLALCLMADPALTFQTKIPFIWRVCQAPPVCTGSRTCDYLRYAPVF